MSDINYNMYLIHAFIAADFGFGVHEGAFGGSRKSYFTTNLKHIIWLTPSFLYWISYVNEALKETEARAGQFVVITGVLPIFISVYDQPKADTTNIKLMRILIWYCHT